jgi:hypothetical protein
MRGNGRKRVGDQKRGGSAMPLRASLPPLFVDVNLFDGIAFNARDFFLYIIS